MQPERTWQRAARVRRANERDAHPDRDFVLYWMTSARRLAYNCALDRACELANSLDRPLLVLEALDCDYPWASARLHRFVLEGMRDNAREARALGLPYYPYVAARPGAGRGLLRSLASRACVVVGDDFPCDHASSVQACAGRVLDVRLELVDSNGILPMRAADRVFVSAHAFRRFLQSALPVFLQEGPRSHPTPPVNEDTRKLLRELVHAGTDAAPAASQFSIADIARRWPMAQLDELIDGAGLASLPIDQSVPPLASLRGGRGAALSRLETFCDDGLTRYESDRNDVESPAASGLSPFLHFGQLSAHEVVERVLQAEDWDSSRLGDDRRGSRQGWWGTSRSSEAFLDQLVTWRELGFNFCSQRSDATSYESLPDWARKTIAEHARDERPTLYGHARLEAADTHDEIWNAAQRELVECGRMHNYLRMLWGKKIFEWSASAQEALATMIELNNRYALDGRDPNSYSGIFWVLGRYDRAWGPERPIFGKLRYMTSANTRRKLRLSAYLERFGCERGKAGAR